MQKDQQPKEATTQSKPKQAPLIPIAKDDFDLTPFVNLRHWMHQNPELSLEEFKTIKRIKETFTNVLKVPEADINQIHKTGLIVDIKGKAAPKGDPFTIALRSDHDALPLHEENEGLSYKSQNKGVTHACGHDGHTSCLLAGTSLILRNLDKIPSNKTVRIVCQPGEEGFNGAEAMVKAGALEGVDEIYGLHNRPDGSHDFDIKISDGPMHSHCNFYWITVSPFFRVFEEKLDEFGDP